MSLDIFSAIKELLNKLFNKPAVQNLPAAATTSAPPPAVVSSDPVPDGHDPAPAPALPTLVTGSAFIQANINLVGATREANILKEFQIGNFPEFLRNWAVITVSDGTNTLQYQVMSDYLSIGGDDDYVRVPMNPHTAQAIADQYGCTLITRKMCNDIWKQSPNKLEPRPWGPPYNADMEKTHRIGTHSATIQKQLTSAGLNPHALTSGHKKDVVLTNKLHPNNPGKRVAIYGWIQSNGQPIQGLNPTSHDDKYADYSHGIRLVNNNALLNGQLVKMQDIFSHPVYSKLVSDEGPLLFKRY